MSKVPLVYIAQAVLFAGYWYLHKAFIMAHGCRPAQIDKWQYIRRSFQSHGNNSSCKMYGNYFSYLFGENVLNEVF